MSSERLTWLLGGGALSSLPSLHLHPCTCPTASSPHPPLVAPHSPFAGSSCVDVDFEGSRHLATHGALSLAFAFSANTSGVVDVPAEVETSKHDGTPTTPRRIGNLVKVDVPMKLAANRKSGTPTWTSSYTEAVDARAEAETMGMTAAPTASFTLLLEVLLIVLAETSRSPSPFLVAPLMSFSTCMASFLLPPPSVWDDAPRGAT